MMLQIQGYVCQLTYKPGKEMLLADALSRYSDPGNKFSMDAVVHPLNMSDEMKEQFQQEIATDLQLKALMESIVDG